MSMGEDLFPSYILATATMKAPRTNAPGHFGDWREMVGVRLSSTGENTKVRVEIGSTKLIKRSKLDLEVKSDGVARYVYPP